MGQEELVMQVRMETLTCLKERLLNFGSGENVFASKEAHRRWLFGEEGAAGFIRDPRTALAQNVGKSKAADISHHGVIISDQEDTEIRSLLKRLSEQGRSLMGVENPRMATPDGMAMACTIYDPADCWY